jgi:hypothetical protein
MKILHIEDTYPNSCYPTKYKLSIYLLESDLPFQFDHLFVGGTLN